MTKQIRTPIKALARLQTFAATPMSLVRPYLKLSYPRRYDNIFQKYGSGNGKIKYRIYVPANGKPSSVKVHVPQDIVDYLATKNMVVSDYKLGTALLPDGKRVIRIGKALADNPRLSKLYQEDPQRSLTKTGSTWVVISRHPYDILGSSFDRGWTSCLNVDDGVRKEYLKADIKTGALVAYLIRDTDRNINNPIARIMMRVYASEDQKVILVPGPTYGTSSIGLTSTVAQFCKWANSGSPPGEYVLSKGSYDEDGIPTRIYHMRDTDTIPTDNPSKAGLAKNPHTPPEVLVLLSKEKHWSVRENVAANKNTPSATLSLLARDKEDTVRMRVAENSSTPVDVLEFLYRDKNVTVREMVSRNENTPVEILVLMSKDKYGPVKMGVAVHPNTPVDIMDILASDTYYEVRKYVAMNPNTSVGTLTKLSKDAVPQVRLEVAENPSTPADVLWELAEDKLKTIRNSAVENPNYGIQV